MNLTRRQINVNVWTDCKVFDPLYYFCRQYSSSLLMIMTVEKCFALYFPLKSKIICTVSTAKKICATVAFALFGWNLQHVFLSDGKTSSNGEKYCIWLHIPLYYIKALNLSDLSLYSYITIIVYCVTIILNYLNHSINGVLYCVSGSRFRQELRSLFGSCGRKRSAISNIMNTVTSQVSSTHLPSHVSISINRV